MKLKKSTEDKIYFGKAEVIINDVKMKGEDISVIIDHFLKDEERDINILNVKPKLHYMGHSIKIKNGDETLLKYSIKYIGEIKDE